MNHILAKDITKDYTASYASYVATSRAIPSLVDGLKPVARRCINSADDLKLYHDKKFLKVAKLEGQVMGDYHPHGGASMIILAQPFKTRYPLFEGQGNFGCPDNPNSVAASRYIETRLTKFCEDFYLESAKYADREDNYDGRLKEVVRYYPPIPGSLLTGASGIAVGFSTDIPTHRISDICKSMLEYISSPDSDKYLKHMMPETCEQSIIMTTKKDIEKLYLTGECSIKYKAKTHYESIEGKLALVVDAFPPDYSKKRLETSYILEAVEAGNLELRNESSTDIRYVFLSPYKEVLEAVEERLVSSKGYRMYIEHNGQIKLYNLKDLYEDFISARSEYIVRKYSDLWSKLEIESEFLRVLMLFKSDKTYIKSIFEKTPELVVKEIMHRYQTTKDIASRIISMSISSMMKDSDTDKMLKKREEILEQIAEYKSYVENPLSKIILDIKSLYLDYRREERRATHCSDIKDIVTIKYNGCSIKAHPSSMFYLATKDNNYCQASAAELSNTDLSDKIIVSSDYEYYVFYDKLGLVAVTKEMMSKMDSKFKSEELVGIIGTNDLSKITLIRSNTKRIVTLSEGYLRTRLSYIQQVNEGEYIELVAQD